MPYILPQENPNGNSICFFSIFSEQINKLEHSGNLRTAETYRAAHRKFFKFCNCEDIRIDNITADLMEAYQASLRQQNLSMNTVSFYMRILRTVYNKAVKSGLAEDQHPFIRVYTGQAKTCKRAISIEDIRKIKEVRLLDRKIAFARDLFLFSFYTRGMSFVDIAYLQKNDIKDGILTYKRHKTGQILSIQWEPEMQNLVDQWASAETSPYLLPIIHKQNGKERNQYRHIQAEVNKHLKVVAKQTGLTQNLSMYCARHSWASIARQIHIPTAIISQGMGHTHERTTEIYLKSISSQTIDSANRQIISLLQANRHIRK